RARTRPHGHPLGQPCPTASTRSWGSNQRTFARRPRFKQVRAPAATLVPSGSRATSESPRRRGEACTPHVLMVAQHLPRRPVTSPNVSGKRVEEVLEGHVVRRPSTHSRPADILRECSPCSGRQ